MPSNRSWRGRGEFRLNIAAEAAEPLGKARLRRAWWFGGTLILCVLLATVAVAWNDLRVRRDAGARYLQALVDSHARQTGQDIRSIERAFHGLAVGLEAVAGVAPEVAPVYITGAIERIAIGHRHVRGLRVDAQAPAFALSSRVVPYRVQMGKAAPDAEGRWVIPLANPFDMAVDGTAPLNHNE